MVMSERERFEKYAKARSLPLDRMADGRYRNMHANEAWLAWQARCPEGWQCVPVEPTEAMSERFMQKHALHYHENGERQYRPLHTWKAMLAAAPKPEDAE